MEVKNHNGVWDSGWVESAQDVWVPYGGHNVYLDGICLKRSWGGEVRNMSVLVTNRPGCNTSPEPSGARV